METMTPVQDLEVVTLVNIALHHPTITDESILLTYVFDRQPQIDDIIRAYAADSVMRKHDYFNDYGPVLTHCLKTFGVPQLYEMHMQDADSGPIQVPSVMSKWTANLSSRNSSMLNHEFGWIRVFIKAINLAKRIEPLAQAEVKRKPKTPAAKSKSVVKPSNGLPERDTKTGLEKSPKRARNPALRKASDRSNP